MSLISWSFITAVACLMSISVSGCSRQSPSTARLQSDGTRDQLVVDLSKLIGWLLENNDRCYIDFSEQGQSPSKECSDQVTFVRSISGRLNTLITDSMKERLAQVPHATPEETITITDAAINDVIFNLSVAMKAHLPSPIDDSAKRFILMIAKSPITSGPVKLAGLFHAFEMGFYAEDLIYDYLATTTITPSQASYDGETSTIKFTDHALEDRMLYLAMAFLHAPDLFKKQFLRLDRSKQEHWRLDTNTAGGDSRVELHDVMVVLVKNIFKYMGQDHVQFDMNAMELGRLATSAFDNLIGSDNSESEYARELIVFRKDNDLTSATGLMVCPSSERMRIGSLEKRTVVPTTYHFKSPFKIVDLGASPDLVNQLVKGSVLECGNKIYKYSGSSLGGGKKFNKPTLGKPAAVTKAVFSTALVKEMNSAAMYGAVAYLASKGYYVTPAVDWQGVHLWSEVADLKVDYLNEVKDANVIVPVAHSTNLNRVDIGSSKALKIRATKSVLRNDGTYGSIDLVFYTPPFYAGTFANLSSLTRDELATMLSSRREIGMKGPVVMSTSCFSEKTLDIWMNAYGKSVEKETEHLTPDAPIVFGSRRGFATDSSLQILSHFEFPLGVVDGVARGDSVASLIGFLNTVPQTYQKQALEFVQKVTTLPTWETGLEKGFWQRREDGFNQTFAPVVNIDSERFWDGTTRLNLRFENVNDPTDVVVY